MYDEWAKDYNSGMTTREIGIKYSVNSGLVYYHLNKRGFKFRNRAFSKMGSNNPMWKGDSVGYHQLHRWIESTYGKPKECSICHKERFLDLANISQEYRRDPLDWEWLCRSCHMKKDGRMGNLHISRPKPFVKCGVADCERKHRANGWCSMHYQRAAYRTLHGIKLDSRT
jgi:hypothetical protein